MSLPARALRLSAPVQEHVGPLLEVENLGVRFGGIVALDDVSFSVPVGRICGLIGPNGAGKTTLFNCLTRVYEPKTGAIRFAGKPILGLKRHEIAARGLARTFQNLALFGIQSVLDNVMVGAHSRGRGGFLEAALATPRLRAQERETRAKALALLEEFGLADLAERPVGELPFATQKRVELARALASGPKMLLLDEPAGGLNHEEVDRLRREITDFRDKRGLTVLLVEHHMNLVMRVSDQVVVLDFGRKIADGPPEVVRADPEVVRAYLGAAA